MSLLKFADFDISKQETVRMAAVTTCLPVVAQSLVRDTPLPEPIIYNAPHHPVYRITIDGEPRGKPTCDIYGVYVVIGEALCNGAVEAIVYEGDTLLYEVRTHA